ncbi:MAG: hypothetical protein ACR2Q4_11490, partial [Geminicoccaceae bacterium]
MRNEQDRGLQAGEPWAQRAEQLDDRRMSRHYSAINPVPPAKMNHNASQSKNEILSMNADLRVLLPEIVALADRAGAVIM